MTGSVTPTATPTVLKALPSYLLDRNSPAVLRLRHAPKALPWLLRFIGAGMPAEVDCIAAALRPLASCSLEAHRTLAALAGAEGLTTQRLAQGLCERSRIRHDSPRPPPDGSTRGDLPVLNRKEVTDLEPNLDPARNSSVFMNPKAASFASRGDWPKPISMPPPATVRCICARRCATSPAGLEGSPFMRTAGQRTLTGS